MCSFRTWAPGSSKILPMPGGYRSRVDRLVFPALPLELQPSRFQVARWVTCETGGGAAADERELKRFLDANSHRVAYDAVDAPTVLVEYAPELRAIESNWPKIKFHALREHAGLVFHKQM